MKILVCGDRGWRNGALIERMLVHYGATMIIHGAARGADLLGEAAAKHLQIPYLGIPAEWDKLVNSAGPIRNQRMLDKGKPDMVLAFHGYISGSKGTKDMIERAAKAGVPTVLIAGEEDEPCSGSESSGS